jgi:hypothetical protein
MVCCIRFVFHLGVSVSEMCLFLIHQRQNVLLDMDNDVSLEDYKTSQMFFRGLTADLIIQIRASSSELDEFSFKALTFC